jgi:mRNA interferase MazF
MIRSPLQWQVVTAVLDPARGSEQTGERPVLIVSREALNAVLPIVIVLPLTTYRAGRRVYATEVLLPAGAAGQPNDSIVMAHQVRFIARERLRRDYGWLTDEGLRERVRQAMRVHLDLE